MMFTCESPIAKKTWCGAMIGGMIGGLASLMTEKAGGFDDLSTVQLIFALFGCCLAGGMMGAGAAYAKGKFFDRTTNPMTQPLLPNVTINIPQRFPLEIDSHTRIEHQQLRR